MTEDARLERARDFADTSPSCYPGHPIYGLIEYAEERLRVNVGLVNENAALRRSATRQPEVAAAVDLLTILQEHEATGSRDFGRGYAHAIAVLTGAVQEARANAVS